MRFKPALAEAPHDFTKEGHIVKCLELSNTGVGKISARGFQVRQHSEEIIKRRRCGVSGEALGSYRDAAESDSFRLHRRLGAACSKYQFKQGRIATAQVSHDSIF